MKSIKSNINIVSDDTAAVVQFFLFINVWFLFIKNILKV